MRNLFFAFITLLIFSCNKDDNNTDIIFTQRSIAKIEGPAGGSINQTVPILVYWHSTSGSCDVLDRFEESNQGSIIFIKAFGYLNGGICTMDAPIKTKTYHFISKSAGTFELRFLNMDSSFLSHMVTIN